MKALTTTKDYTDKEPVGRLMCCLIPTSNPDKHEERNMADLFRPCFDSLHLH